MPVDGSAPHQLTDDREVIWPPQASRFWEREISPDQFDRLALTDGENHVYLFDLNGLTQASVPRPGGQASIADLKGNCVAWRTFNRNTAELWLGSRSILELNSSLPEIDPPILKSFSYKTARGEELTAWILLPGDRLPSSTVVHVCPGHTFDPSKPPGAVKLIDYDSGQVDGNNMRLLATRGYAVLFPSIPVKPFQEPRQYLPDGVLPAVDRAVELGYCRKDAIALIGHSGGGYVVNLLVTLTDLVQNFYEIQAPIRYLTDVPEMHLQNHVNNFEYVEREGDRGNVPPCQDWQRYDRNSALRSAEKIKTPLLLVTCDQDYVSSAQAESMFLALHRQKKPVRLVRFIGEGHIVQSPANVRRLWKEIDLWLDRYMKH
jgi:dipeptidyl aminopeptidase/acylaminoacyl peptidase